MTWSYNVEDLDTSLKDQVRFRIGDTDSNDPLLEDEEIMFVASLYGNNELKTSIQCCNSIIAKLSKQINFTIGPYSENVQSRLNNYLSLQNSLNKQLYQNTIPIAKKATTQEVFTYDIMSLECCGSVEDE